MTVAVVTFHKNTGYIGPVTSCDKKDAQRIAKYYRNIGYRAQVMTYEELDAAFEAERKERAHQRLLQEKNG